MNKTAVISLADESGEATTTVLDNKTVGGCAGNH